MRRGGDRMTNWYERYLQGDYEQVYAELQG